MKKQRFLFALFMAIVMMAMSPTRAWAHYVQVGNNRYELSEINLGGSPGEHLGLGRGVVSPSLTK